MDAMTKKIFYFVLVLLLVQAVSAAWPTSYTGVKSKAVHFVGRLLCLVQTMSPPIILIFIVLGGVKYIMADDPSEAMAAKHMVLDAVIGGFCILFFIAAAGALGVPVYCEVPS